MQIAKYSTLYQKTVEWALFDMSDVQMSRQNRYSPCYVICFDEFTGYKHLAGLGKPAILVACFAGPLGNNLNK